MNESEVQRAISGKDKPNIVIVEPNPERKTIREIVMELCESNNGFSNKKIVTQ